MAAEFIFRQIKGVLLAVAVAAGVIYLLIALGSVPAPEHTVQDQPVSSLPPGSEGQLQNGNSAIPVAIDEDLLPDLIRAQTASDYANAISNLSGRIFFVTIVKHISVSSFAEVDRIVSSMIE